MALSKAELSKMKTVAYECIDAAVCFPSYVWDALNRLGDETTEKAISALERDLASGLEDVIQKRNKLGSILAEDLREHLDLTNASAQRTIDGYASSAEKLLALCNFPVNVIYQAEIWPKWLDQLLRDWDELAPLLPTEQPDWTLDYRLAWIRQYQYDLSQACLSGAEMRKEIREEYALAVVRLESTKKRGKRGGDRRSESTLKRAKIAIDEYDKLLQEGFTLNQARTKIDIKYQISEDTFYRWQRSVRGSK